MNKLLTFTAAVVAASMALSTAAFAGGSGGKNRNSAKSLTFALSGAKSHVRVRTGGCGCYGQLHVDGGSYQRHNVYSNHYGTGGSSTAGNYLHAGWKGGAHIQYSGSAFAIGGAAIISGGSKKRPGGNMEN